jgi:cytidylate kinase
VVFPKADLKLFVTASEDIRVQRRFDELKSKGLNATIEDVKINLSERDYLDTHREISPLIQVEDAIVLDNSNMTKEEQMEYVLSLIENLN